MANAESETNRTIAGGSQLAPLLTLTLAASIPSNTIAAGGEWQVDHVAISAEALPIHSFPMLQPISVWLSF
jgi:hypothetical protein